MKIIRGGKEIELSCGELLEAYLEQEHNYDVDEITQELDFRYGLDDPDDPYIRQILNSAELISEIASEKRRRMNYYHMGDSAAVEESVDEAISKLKHSNTSK